MNDFYSEFTQRNYGFFDQAEQEILKNSKIFIPGVGGMGGTVFECLVRIGVENFIIADFDVFEVSNLNRQIFCTGETLNKSKVESAVVRAKSINPNIKIKTYGQEWTDYLSKIVSEVDLVVNGCDDIKSTVLLVREAKKQNKFVVDAFASTLPNVYVVDPEGETPEEFHQFPTQNLQADQITAEIQKQCMLKEIEYVIVHTTAMNYVVKSAVEDLVNGKRKRFSMCSMVWMTGTLMSYEAIKIILKKENKASLRGYFINPWTCESEKPSFGMKAFFKKWMLKRYLKSL